MSKVLVIGTGTMGSGISQVCAQAGYDTIIMDEDGKMVTQGLDQITWSLTKLEEKSKLKEPKESILKRIETAKTLDPASEADFVIEAIYENLEAKQQIFKQLCEICSEKTILGSNTSSLPITEIAAKAQSPERIVGIHFFVPAQIMKLVEIVKGLLTSQQTLKAAKEFAASLGKEPVVVNQDSAGFIVNRINGKAFLEALRLLEKGVASAEDIDKAMRLGLGYPMGPFQLMDMVGLDIVLNARMGVYNETREPLHYPPMILQRMVKAGRLGRKTKKGFYDYSK